MAKKVRTKAPAKAPKKKASGLLKFLEAIVVVGAVAGVLMKIFKGGKAKK